MAGITPISEQTAIKVSELNKNRNIKERVEPDKPDSSISGLRAWVLQYATDVTGMVAGSTLPLAFSEFRDVYVPGMAINVQAETATTYSTHNNGIIGVSQFPGADDPSMAGYAIGWTFRCQGSGGNNLGGRGSFAAIDTTLTAGNNIGNIYGGGAVVTSTTDAKFSSTGVIGATPALIEFTATLANGNPAGSAGNDVPPLVGDGGEGSKFNGPIAGVTGTIDLWFGAPPDGAGALGDLDALDTYTHTCDGTDTMMDIMEKIKEDVGPNGIGHYLGNPEVNILHNGNALTDPTGAVATAVPPAGTVITFNVPATPFMDVDTLVADWNTANPTYKLTVNAGGAEKPKKGEEMTPSGGALAGDTEPAGLYFGPTSGPGSRAGNSGHQLDGNKHYTITATPNAALISAAPMALKVRTGYMGSTGGGMGYSSAAEVSLPKTSPGNIVKRVAMCSPVHPAGDSLGTLADASIHSTP
jgi:hypothetical protein